MSKENKPTQNKPKKLNEPVLFEESYMQPSKGSPYIYLIIFVLAVIVIFGKKFIIVRDVPVSVTQDQPIQGNEN